MTILESGGISERCYAPTPVRLSTLFFPKEENQILMAKTVATLLGVLFILVGLIGFVAPGFLGTHLSLAHNLVHLISGAVSLYFGLKGTLAAARLFCIVFGLVYGLLGLCGFLLGGAGQHTIPGITHGTDSRLLTVIPGSLEFATMDHVVHLLLAVIYLIGGFMTRADVRRD
jgi:asparagine N-glycosylation enzyme membrane subunit Stt3